MNLSKVYFYIEDGVNYKINLTKQRTKTNMSKHNKYEQTENLYPILFYPALKQLEVEVGKLKRWMYWWFYIVILSFYIGDI